MVNHHLNDDELSIIPISLVLDYIFDAVTVCLRSAIAVFFEMEPISIRSKLFSARKNFNEAEVSISQKQNGVAPVR